MNWGNKLLVTFLVFGTGMGYLVYRSMSTNFELVEKDYYKTELQYQATIDAKNRFSNLMGDVSIEQLPGAIRIQFPVQEAGKVESGKIWFYCAYQAASDRKFDITVDKDGAMYIPVDLLAPARYSVKIDWKAGEKTFYTEKQLTVRK